jgi:hypothetical protein
LFLVRCFWFVVSGSLFLVCGFCVGVGESMLFLGGLVWGFFLHLAGEVVKGKYGD